MQKNSFGPVIAIAAVMGLSIFSGSASAQSLIDLNLGATSSSETEASAVSEQDSGASASTSLDANASASGSADAESSPRDSSAMLSADVLLDGEVLNITRSAVSAGLGADAGAEGEEGEAQASITSSSDVSTNADLEAFARTMIREDENVEEVNFSGDMVEVRYREEGKFLALIPLDFTASAKAYADGRVEIDYPWYSFLTVKGSQEAETRAKVAVDNAIRARAVGSVRAEGETENPRFTAAESATVAAELHSVLRASEADAQEGTVD